MVDACTDLVTSLFSPERVEAVLGIATDSTASALEREKVASWICASSSAIDTVKSRFSEYPDVVVPFVMGMVQVRMCVLIHLFLCFLPKTMDYL